MVIFMCQLDWAKRYPDSWLNIILVMSVRMCLEEFSIWIVKLSQEDSPSCFPSKALCNPLKSWIEQRGRRWLHSLSAWLFHLEHQSSFSSLLLLRPSDSFWNLHHCFSRSQHSKYQEFSCVFSLKMADYGKFKFP